MTEPTSNDCSDELTLLGQSVCPNCGYLTMPRVANKVPVERLHVGDLVQAVEWGPLGRVIDGDRCGWTLVEWGPKKAVLPYEHDTDSLYLLEAA